MMRREPWFFSTERQRGAGNRKHSDEKIAEAKRRLALGQSIRGVARDLGMGQQTVGDIKRGRLHAEC